MTRYIQGSDRNQVTLLPECLDDFIGEDNPVRVIDVFVDELNLVELGFERMQPAATGRPGYHPAMLLKLYIYGYLNRLQSSRRLEREAQRNVELMWLTGRLVPDFKTIADFRHNNGTGIRNVCGRFVAMCRQLKLFAQVIVAIDGSKFKAVNNRDKNFTQHKLEQRMKQVDESIERYMRELETADRTQQPEVETNTQRLQDKIAFLKKQMQELRDIGERLAQQPDGQISLTDPEARSMVSSRIGTGLVGYNVQAAVDTKHHLVVAHDVITSGSDRGQLANMAFKAREATGDDSLEAIADRGYFKSTEIRACELEGINTYVPKPMTSNSKAQGRYSKLDFVYIAKDNAYRCPAGQSLGYSHSTIEDGMNIHVYIASDCTTCPQKSQCTTGKQRRVRRWEHEGVLDTMQTRIDNSRDKMKLRRCTVEHVFGTVK
ncbi:Transposase, partial [Collimonas sp. OK607]|uniref:IS1182 family transposase n=1 Tax=Collimonas sp. OK607 TaxID=1798194 RepID=UPI0008EF8882